MNSGYRAGPNRAGPTPRFGVVAGTALVLAAIGCVAFLVMFMGGWKSVPVDKVALHYTGGPIQGQHFEEVVAPGTRARFYGLLEQLHELPATQRNYIMSKNPGEGDRRHAEFVGAPTRDKVVVEWESATYFKLNTDGPVVRTFFEQICLKYECTDLSPGGGWDRMLADTFRQQIVAAIQAEARRYTAEDIFSNRETLLRIQSEVGSTLKERVAEVLGGEFFCGPTYRPSLPSECPDFSFLIKEVTLPQPLLDQYRAVEEARTKATEKRIEAEGEAAKQNVLRAPQNLTPSQLVDYMRVQAEMECARREGCLLVAGNGPSGVVVSPPGDRRDRPSR